MLMTAQQVCAQRIKVVDEKGEAVPYASIIIGDAQFIGFTNLEGEFPDVKGSEEVTVTHIAYQPKTVKVQSLTDGLITLEDAEYNLSEVTVKPKPYVYVQTYYRMYFFSEKDGIMYYRTGLTDNTYDVNKKKLTADTKNTSKSKYSALKVVLNALVGSKYNKNSYISLSTMEKRLLKRGEASKLKITDIAPGKKQISDFKGVVGMITDDHTLHQRRYTLDAHAIYLHKMEAEGQTKEVSRTEKIDQKRENKVENDFFVYQIDQNGQYNPEDFVMSQYMTSYDYKDKDGTLTPCIICVQVFSTDRAYVDKEELKAIKAKNKMKMSYQNVKQFEKDHKIPAIAPNVQKKLDELWKADSTD